MTATKEAMAQDIHWQAWQYAAGDLPASEAEAFELQLAVDQPTREALASAVEMTQAAALALAEPMHQPATAAESRPWQREMLAGFGLCASLLLALSLGWWAASSHSPSAATAELGKQSQPQDQATDELAAQWAKAAEFAQSSGWNGEESLTELPLDAFDSLEIADTAPEWMLAAVSDLKEREAMMDEAEEMQGQ